MTTALLDVRLSKDFAQAIQELSQDKVVAVPTETVYGLATNACSSQACNRVYQYKSRPMDNPLIVHCCDIDMVAKCVSHTERKAIIPIVRRAVEEKLSLTFVTKASDYTSIVARAGLDSIAVRIPHHKQFNRLIRALGKPLAAPSANPSGAPSATNPLMVWEYYYGVLGYIVDGGACRYGLESTVVDMRELRGTLLREGACSRKRVVELFSELFSVSAIASLNVPQKTQAKKQSVKASKGSECLYNSSPSQASHNLLARHERPTSPGTKYKHYTPRTPVIAFSYSTHSEDLVIESAQDKKYPLYFSGIPRSREHQSNKQSNEHTVYKEYFACMRQALTQTLAFHSGCKIALVCGPVEAYKDHWKHLALQDPHLLSMLAQYLGATICMYKQYANWEEYRLHLFSDFNELDASEANFGIFEYPIKLDHAALRDRLMRAAQQVYISRVQT